MINIGIIGAENSHAKAFSKALNLPDGEGRLRYPDMQVIRVWGPEDSAQILAKEANIPVIAESPADFDDCDAIMITTRSGSEHYEQIIKYIRKGVPVFIDKPYTVSVEEARLLAQEANRSGSLICGGSACKYAPDVLALAEQIKQLRQEGKLKTASVNFNVWLKEEYDGFFFYAHHLIEIAFTLFGRELVSLRASRLGDTVTVNAVYPDMQVTLHFTQGVGDSTCTLYASSGVIFRQFDISTIFDEELKVFVEMLRTKQRPFPAEDIIAPVTVAEAIYRSYTKEETVALR